MCTIGFVAFSGCVLSISSIRVMHSQGPSHALVFEMISSHTILNFQPCTSIYVQSGSMDTDSESLPGLGSFESRSGNGKGVLVTCEGEWNFDGIGAASAWDGLSIHGYACISMDVHACP